MRKLAKRSCSYIYIYILVALFFPVASFFILVSPAVLAASNSASASVVVPANYCGITTNATNNTPHTATINAGTYQADIGTTTFKIVCGDKGGFSVYAIGYANDEMGNNKLLANINGTLVPSHDILTGTATSGDTSNWAMKLTSVAGTFAPTLENGYGNYSAVPATNTKVATFPSTTDEYQGSSFTATYAAYINQMQPAGTYNGKVKYTMVHPASDIPNQPVATTAGKIGYVPNANGNVVDTMGDQQYTGYTGTISNFITPITPGGEVTLWPSNFKRDGYGFVGWSDKYDWVLNENDANGNGTGINDGYHIYGPNQTITAPADINTKGLTLYAVWTKSAGNIQNWSCPNNTIMPVGAVTALTDTRDNNTYAVAKLADNNCWIIENLRLGGSQQINLTTTDSALSINLTLPASIDAFATSFYTNIEMNATNTLSPATNITTTPDNNTAVYSYGNYYSWPASIGTTTAYNTHGTNVTTSICPKGWSLPLGNSVTTTNKSFSYLDVQLGGTGVSQTTTFISNRWRTYPTNFIYAGCFGDSSTINRGSFAYFWSSTVYSSQDTYGVILGNSRLDPGSTNLGKYFGRTIRCIAN